MSRVLLTSMCSAIQPSSRAMFDAIRSAKHFLPSSEFPPYPLPYDFTLRSSGKCASNTFSGLHGQWFTTFSVQFTTQRNFQEIQLQFRTLLYFCITLWSVTECYTFRFWNEKLTGHINLAFITNKKYVTKKLLNKCHGPLSPWCMEAVRKESESLRR